MHETLPLEPPFTLEPFAVSLAVGNDMIRKVVHRPAQKRAHARPVVMMAGSLGDDEFRARRNHLCQLSVDIRAA